VRPLCEADLAVRVKDDGINKARNVLEVAEHLSYVVAFIELPDAFIATNATVTGAMLTAANVGARLAIVGQRMAVEPTAAFVEALATMRVTMKDQDGNILGQGKGSDILDHPLHSVLWLNEQLKREGLELKEGDLISLGGLNMLTPRSGQTITVVYEGLPDGPISASVQFQ
jgi:2-keto-4-pentenoate hydratase